MAWAKLVYLRDRGSTEIGAFGLSSAEDLLLVTDILLVKQRCTLVTVAFDDAAVADLFDASVDAGIAPARFGRIWIHTHPGSCPLPSSTDEATFGRVFATADWSVMAIVARGDASYARLAFRAGPAGSLEIPVHVDYRQPFPATDWPSWEQAYLDHVIVETVPSFEEPLRVKDDAFKDADSLWDWEGFYDELSSA